jgi:hypothetical protein
VAFAGLGAFDRFDEAALATVGENLIRTLAAARIDDFATVLLGANSGIPSLSALRQLISGVLKGLADADPDQRFRSITICERDEERFNAIYAALYGLAGADLFADLEVTLQRTVLPEAPASEAPIRAARAPAADRIYLIVRQDTDRLDQEGFTASLLTGGGAAAIESGRSDLRDDQGDLDQHLARLAAEQEMDAKALTEFGDRLGVLTLPENVRLALGRNSNRHLVVVHDAGASRVPWEALAIEGVFPSAQAGMSHRYEAADLSVAKWLKAQQEDRVLRVLLVVNPTGDLPGAKEEGDRIQALFDRMQGRLEYQRLEGQQARKPELLRCFSAGRFDVVHYAGHAFFDQASRSRSGLLCADREVLSGADLARVSNLPQLMFFNACEAAKVRKSGPEDTAPARSATQVFRNVSFAEALLRGGVANFIGTYWPVGDESAEAFAQTFYETLLQSAPLNTALLAARRKVRDLPSRDWADYVFYGDPDFRVKLGGSPPGELPARLPASA